MKEIDKQSTYYCLECGKEFRGYLTIPVWYKKQVIAYKCPYCHGKIKLKEVSNELPSPLPKAVCPKCGKVYYGWALLEPEYQTCDCGTKLEISNGGD